MFQDVFRGKRVWLSGHTGFKGSWLATWLLQLGAEVYGFALEPPTEPSLFAQLGLASQLHHQIGDIRDREAVQRSLHGTDADFVFHLAAQPLVRLSYQIPQETYETNVMGTVNVLEVLRQQTRACTAIFITTDKCYENREWLYAYREEDHLGGYDPYSSSKAAAEIAIAAYRQSFFSKGSNAPVQVASARAGNVIGGGDWAFDRIVPDSIRFLQREEPIPVRNRTATRPWQHVLEPLSGYLCLAAALAQSRGREHGETLCSAFNFGPGLASNRTVEEVVTQILTHWPGEWIDKSDPHAVHEAGRLNLAIDRAFHLLHWFPVWDFKETIAQTVHWYRRATGADRKEEEAVLKDLTLSQVEDYTTQARACGLSWADL